MKDAISAAEQALAEAERSLDFAEGRTSLLDAVMAALRIRARAGGIPVSVSGATPRDGAEKLGPRIRDVIFSAVRRESDLYVPVAAWLKEKGLQTYPEVPMGRCRADVVGYREGNWLRGTSVVAVELKAADEQMKRGLDQIATYRSYAHRVYMACTPAEIADYLDRHAEARGVHHWDDEALYRKLTAIDCGLLIVEGTKVFEFIEPTETEVDSKKLAEVTAAIARIR